MYYKTEVLKSRKKENLLVFFLISILISICFTFIITTFFLKIYKVKSYIHKNAPTTYYLVNIFTEDFKENAPVLAKVNNKIITKGKILAKGPVNIQLHNDEIIIGNKIIFIKNPLPIIFDKNSTLVLNKDEYFILSENHIDSFYYGKFHKNQILGKIIYEF